MQPFKHYEADAIQVEIDRSHENPDADESTLKRWRTEFQNLKNHIEGTLRALWSQIHGVHYPLLKQDSLLDLIRKHEPRWLRFVNKALINRKLSVHTQFAFCP